MMTDSNYRTLILYKKIKMVPRIYLQVNNQINKMMMMIKMMMTIVIESKILYIQNLDNNFG